MKEKNTEKGFSLQAVLVILLLISSIEMWRIYERGLTEKHLKGFERRYRLERAVKNAMAEYLGSAEVLKDTIFNYKTGGEDFMCRIKLDTGLTRITAHCRGIRFKDTIEYIYEIKKRIDPIMNNAVVMTNPLFRGTYTGTTKILGDFASTSRVLKPGKIPNKPEPNKQYLFGKHIIRSDVQTFAKKMGLAERLQSYAGSREWKKRVTKQIELNNPDEIQNLTERARGGGEATEYIYITKRIDHFWKTQSPNVKVIVYGEQMEITEETADLRGYEFFVEGDVYIGGGTELKGGVIYSLGTVTIENGAVLNDISICSEEGIEILNIQGNYCTEILLINRGGEDIKEIRIEGSILNGIVCYLETDVEEGNPKGGIVYEERTTIHGLVISEGYVTPVGRTIGTLISKYTEYRKGTTLYRDWFINSYIDKTAADSTLLLPGCYYAEIYTDGSATQFAARNGRRIR